MATISEHLRKRLLENAGYPHDHLRVPDLPELQQTEWSEEFEQLCRNRMIMGAFRYGLLETKSKGGYDLVAGLQKKLAMYAATGNLENIVDVANYAFLIFRFPAHPSAHFHGEDDHDHVPVLFDENEPKGK